MLARRRSWTFEEKTLTTLYRIGISLERNKKELSAHTIASFLVAQGVESVSDLRSDVPMNKPALRFVNDLSAINYWLSTGRLDLVDDAFVLTAVGIQECVDRESGDARDAAGRRKKECVTPELIRQMRDAILHGRYHDDRITFSQQEFELS